MAYWLLKSEPSAYSWDEMVKDKRTDWTGVRNFSARINLNAMKKGDEAFFYHSGEGKEIVGMVEISGTAKPDKTDKTGKFVMVEVKAASALKKPVTLAAIKADKDLKNMVFVKQSRLSVSPVSAAEWKRIVALGK
jgi:predicted RNA-binding protein with PUA-like domain